LAQVGAHAASKFAQRLESLKLLPQHAGILRMLDGSPAVTQQALAERLGVVPSRLVGLLDELEARGLIERRPNPGDRRSYALHLTDQGRDVLGAIGRVAREHQQELLESLSESERQELGALLLRVADAAGLTRGVHPGFKRLEETSRR
jgi:DNA-binding MarR family transcriptional regulator